MKKNLNKPGVYITLAVIMAVVVLACLCFQVAIDVVNNANRHDYPVASIYEVYSIDSKTTLQSLEDGNTNVFTKLGEGEEYFMDNLNLPEVSPPVHWEYTDYLTITNAFLQNVVGKPLRDWKLYSLGFQADCQDIVEGAQNMDIEIFHFIDSQNEESKTRLHLGIYPKSEQVNRLETKYSPYFESVSTLELEQINIPIEEVLKIAETNGGKQVRESINNMCEVTASITAEIINNDWSVTYRSNGETLMEVFVDEQTGEYKIISGGK